MKTTKLKYIPNYDFELIGISTSENDYKLSWLISKSLNIEFCRCKDLKIIEPKTKEEFAFSVFENYNEENYKLRIISNKGIVGYLIPELKNIDYFLSIHNSGESILVEDIIVKLKAISGISGVFKLDIQKLKSKERFTL